MVPFFMTFQIFQKGGFFILLPSSVRSSALIGRSVIRPDYFADFVAYMKYLFPVRVSYTPLTLDFIM